MKPMLSGVAAAVVALAAPGVAAAGPVQRVLVLGHGHVHAVTEPTTRFDRRLPAPRRGVAARAPAFARARATKTVLGALKALRADGAITAAEYRHRARTWRHATATIAKLYGRRRVELSAVAANVSALAHSGQLTAARLEPVFLTLERNRQWWTTGPLLAYGARVQFDGSSMLWESYPGQGIQLHPLANWSKLLAFLNQYGKWRTHIRPFLEKELLPTAVPRAGGIAWEYYFHFDGGSPPWVSSISQGTALQALSLAAQKLHEPDLLDTAHRALGIFRHRAPLGVASRSRRGNHYLIYSFAPRLKVLNAFIQSLVGLHDLAVTGNDALASKLFGKGDAVARRETPEFDTGGWSLYSLGGDPSSVSYHTLLRDFLEDLCRRTETKVYCRTASRFTVDLDKPARLTLVTRRLKPGHTALVRFRVSKPARVGMTIRRGDTTLLSTSASLSPGAHAYSWYVPGGGDYKVTLNATDVTGHYGKRTQTLVVRR